MSAQANPAQTAEQKRFLSRETRFQGRYSGELVGTLKQAYAPFKYRLLFCLLMGLIGRVAILGNANLIGLWVDSLCKGEGCRPQPAWLAGTTSSTYLTWLTAATVTGFLASLIYRIGVSRLSADAVSRIYDETTLRTSRFPMGFFDSNPAGRVMTRFSSDYNTIFRIFGGPLAEFLSLVFDLVAMTVLIGLASPWFLPIWLLLGAMNYGVYRLNLQALRRERREVARKRSPGIAHFAETAQGAATVRAFGRRQEFERRFAELNDSYLSQRLSLSAVLVRFSISMSVATAVAFVITGVAGIGLIKTGRAGVGAIGVAFTYLGLSTTVLQAFFEWLGQFEEAMTGLERMNEYLRSPLEPGARLPATTEFDTGHPVRAKDEARPAALSGAGVEIEIRDLWMRYRPELAPVLQGIDLSIRPGERVAIIGKTGSGKTSLIQALFRLYPIERGSIRLGGVTADVSESGAIPQGGSCDLVQYRRMLAYITQEPTLFLGTLRENLLGTGTLPDASKDEQLVEALRRVQLLTEGASREEYLGWLDFKVEERGRNLSAGERQLVCMARCLLQDAPVVIMDEATSAVDPRSEEILTRATEEIFRGKTQILIAHRLSTIRQCDRVLWLQKGKIHRMGPPTAVLPEFERSELHV